MRIEHHVVSKHLSERSVDNALNLVVCQKCIDSRGAMALCGSGD